MWLPSTQECVGFPGTRIPAPVHRQAFTACEARAKLPFQHITFFRIVSTMLDAEMKDRWQGALPLTPVTYEWD